jgi:hypothetical protein
MQILDGQNFDFSEFDSYGDGTRVLVQKASVVNNYEDNSWAFVVITCLFA